MRFISGETSIPVHRHGHPWRVGARATRNPLVHNQAIFDPGFERGKVERGGADRGLGVVRSLGRRGIPVGVLTDEHLIAATCVEGHPPASLEAWRLVTDMPAMVGEIACGHLSPRAYFHALRGPPEVGIFALDDPLAALREVPLVAYLSIADGRGCEVEHEHAQFAHLECCP